jgi:hypothetical protein
VQHLVNTVKPVFNGKPPSVDKSLVQKMQSKLTSNKRNACFTWKCNCRRENVTNMEEISWSIAKRKKYVGRLLKNIAVHTA